jgi:hypothetical protein
MSKVSKRPAVRMPTAAEDKAITAAAKSDPDAQPLTPDSAKGNGSLAVVAWATKVRKQEAAGIGALQPRGRCLLQVHGRRLAIAHGRCAASVRSAPFP